MAITISRSESTYRSQLRSWVRQQVKDRHEVVLPDLADLAITHFRDQPDFISGFLKETMRPMVYEIAQAVLTETRERTFQLGDAVVDEEGLHQRADQQTTRWPRWLQGRYEYSQGRHLLALDMTRIDLEAAASERELRGKRELAVAELWRAIAKQMDSDEPVTVSDWFQHRPGELDKIWAEVRAAHPELHD